VVVVVVVVVPPSPDPLPPLSDEIEATVEPPSDRACPLPEPPLVGAICETSPPWSVLPDPLLGTVAPLPDEEPLLDPEPPSSDPPWDPS
jgi:hypothetical protein